MVLKKAKWKCSINFSRFLCKDFISKKQFHYRMKQNEVNSRFEKYHVYSQGIIYLINWECVGVSVKQNILKWDIINHCKTEYIKVAEEYFRLMVAFFKMPVGIKYLCILTLNDLSWPILAQVKVTGQNDYVFWNLS